MTSPCRPPAVLPPPDLVPILPDMSPDAILLGLAVDEALEEWKLVGVDLGSPKIYVYSAPPLTHVGSIVIVPPNVVNSEPQTAEVITLDPPPYPGPIKKVLGVLS